MSTVRHRHTNKSGEYYEVKITDIGSDYHYHIPVQITKESSPFSLVKETNLFGVEIGKEDEKAIPDSLVTLVKKDEILKAIADIDISHMTAAEFKVEILDAINNANVFHMNPYS